MTPNRRLRIVAALALLAACGGEGPTGPVPVATVTVTPAPDTLRALGSTVQLTATARDASGSVLTGRTIVWSSSAPTVVSVNATTGLATAVANGNASLIATVEGEAGQAAVVVAQAVTAVTVLPNTFTLNTLNATQAFTATARDANNNVVAGVRFIWLSSDQSVATVDTNGTARAKGAGQTAITAAAHGVPGNAQLTVNPTATQLVITVPPGNITAGGAFSPAIEVEIRDAGGTRVAAARNPVTIALAANPGAATLLGTTTVNANNGIASFSGLSLTRAAAGYTLAVSAAGMTGATTASFGVAAGAASRIAFVAPISPFDTAGVALGAQVEVTDAHGNRVTGAASSVLLSRVSGPANGQMFPGGSGIGADSIRRTITAGLADFSDIRLRLAGTGYQLQATAPGFGAIQTPVISVSHAPPHHIQLESEPANISIDASVPIGDVYASVRDSVDNITTTVDVEVGVEVVEDPWNTNPVFMGPLVGNTRLTTVAGEVAFGDLRIARPGGLFRLHVTASGVIPDTLQSGFFASLQFGSGIRSGGNQTCAHGGVENVLFCWGENQYGQLGHATAGDVDSVAASPAQNLVFFPVEVGGTHTCITPPGGFGMQCWGDNTWGQLGIGSFGGGGIAPQTVVVERFWFKMSLGLEHTCAVDGFDLSLWCWGRNASGQLGDGTTTDSHTPVQIFPGGVISVAAGATHTCAVRNNNQLYCWGANNLNQLGDSTTTQRLVPTRAARPGLTYHLVVAGASHTCARADSTSLEGMFCWGNNSHGQVGNAVVGGTVSYPVAVAAGVYTSVETRMDLGDRHSCMEELIVNGVFCWGDNGSGQVDPAQPSGGIGIPALVAGTNRGFVIGGVSTGATHSCVRYVPAVTDHVLCWGSNGAGQLGRAHTSPVTSPGGVYRGF